MLFLDKKGANSKLNAEVQHRHESDGTNVQHACKRRPLRLLLLHTAQTVTPREGDEQQVADIPEPPRFGPAVSVIFHATEHEFAHTCTL